MSYNYNLNVFTSGIFYDQLYDEIDNSSITTGVLQSIYQSGGVVTIVFDTALSGGDVTILNAVVAAHVPVTPSNQNVVNVLPNALTINTTTYKDSGIFYFPGKNVYTPTQITATSFISSTGTYAVRIYDHTNNKIIVENNTLTNTSENENDLGTIKNLSLTRAKWQIQTRGTQSGSIKNISLYY